MRIMTSNIWGDFFGNPCEMRGAGLEAVYRKYSPDVIGFQEVTEGWYCEGLLDRLSDEYTLVDGRPKYPTPIMFKKDMFDMIECGWEALTDVPGDSSKTITWAVLRTKDEGKTVAVLNTHFWWMQRGEVDNSIRVINAKQLFARMEYLKKKYACKVFAFGDMNCNIKESAFEYLNSVGVFCSVHIAEDFSKQSSHHGDPIRGEDDLYHGCVAVKDYTNSLDHIVTYKGTNIKRQVVVEDREALDSTDHSPVYIDFELK